MGLAARLAAVATGLIARLGYVGVAAGLVANAAGIPLPSEVILPLTGALVRQGRFGVLSLMIVAVVAQMVGASIGYWLARTGGLALVKRYGRYVWLRESELELTQRLYARYGGWVTVFGCCLPGIHSYVGYPAGLARMPFGRFVVAAAVGISLWTGALVFAGYQLYARLNIIADWLHRFGVVLLGLLAIVLIWYVIRHRKRTA